ncbi:MAG: biopolymer transporter ExbD [Puniceicoccales bacterium]|jgi:biopolymer transport protein ExbD|nr:biopolymer transporter ExbD [Puniceicoccales bacterium]
MPVKLGSKLSAECEARIEVIPLIDIMFFLLASFMLVSIGMVSLKRVQVNLPTATAVVAEMKNNLISISVDKAGVIYLDKTPVGATELALTLKTRIQADSSLRVLISGDADTRHGDMVRVLNATRAAGIQNVSFEVRTIDAKDGAGASSSPKP